MSNDVKNTDATVLALLEPLPTELISSRAGPGGKRVPYLASANAVRIANKILGPTGWSDYVQHPPELVEIAGIPIGFTCTISTSMRDCTRQGVGFGALRGDVILKALKGPDKLTKRDLGLLADAARTAILGSESLALRRSFRTVGEAFGLALYVGDDVDSQDAESPESNDAVNGILISAIIDTAAALGWDDKEKLESQSIKPRFGGRGLLQLTSEELISTYGALQQRSGITAAQAQSNEPEPEPPEANEESSDESSD